MLIYCVYYYVEYESSMPVTAYASKEAAQAECDWLNAHADNRAFTGILAQFEREGLEPLLTSWQDHDDFVLCTTPSEVALKVITSDTADSYWTYHTTELHQ